jgi:prepilin-type N-terminal cleavage/methylation domain-containing protein
MTNTSCFSNSSPQRQRGFTLVQLLVVISLIGVLSALLFGVLGRGRAAARRADCDVHLKEIAMALDTFRQENGRMPHNVAELASKRYVSMITLRCPSDPDLALHANDATYSSYTDFYVLREPRDSGELPVMVCPRHEGDGAHGVQAYKGRYTAQFTTRPALVSSTDIVGSVTITRPGVGVLTLPTAGKTLSLRGGDRVKVGAGMAKINFADGSYAHIEANTEMSILQSYIEGQRSGPLYTLTRQFTGRAHYYVNPGSHFDVATPTATAGALGTRFTVDLTADNSLDVDRLPETILTVQEHTVALTTVNKTVEVEAGEAAYTAEPATPTTQPSTTPSTAEPAQASKPRKPRQRGNNGVGKGNGDDRED